jgi:hypothetical protein
MLILPSKWITGFSAGEITFNLTLVPERSSVSAGTRNLGEQK